MKRFDDELRARFAELKAEEQAHVPAFELPQARSLSRTRRTRRFAITGTALVAAAVAFVFISRRPREPEMTITEWRAPTDVLLEMTGTKWFSEIPTLEYEVTP